MWPEQHNRPEKKLQKQPEKITKQPWTNYKIFIYVLLRGLAAVYFFNVPCRSIFLRTCHAAVYFWNFPAAEPFFSVPCRCCYLGMPLLWVASIVGCQYCRWPLLCVATIARCQYCAVASFCAPNIAGSEYRSNFLLKPGFWPKLTPIEKFTKKLPKKYEKIKPNLLTVTESAHIPTLT